MKCCIRAWRIEDAKELASVLDNKNIQDNLRDGLPLPYTEDDARSYIESLGQADADAVFAFAVEYEGRVVGQVGVTRRGNIHRCAAEIGYYIAEPFWGRGIGTDAVRQACEYVFAHTDVIRIFAESFDSNVASCRLLEKCGFGYEGTLRCHAVKNGRIRDVKMYSLIRPLP